MSSAPLGIRPISIDKDHCKIPDRKQFAGYNIFSTPEYTLKVVKCDWEFNPMHGMMECNVCGMTNG